VAIGQKTQGIVAYSSMGLFDEQTIAEKEYQKLIKQ